MLNLNKKSGVLKIEGKGSGEIYLQGGQLIGAKSGDQEGEEAIYELVTYEKGTFNFEVSDEEFPNNIKSGTMNVIMEACRIMDERRHGE